jgi:uroporphyrinogen-III synthase
MPGSEGKAALTGHHVWVTRPTHQSENLISQLLQHGATVLHVPLLEIDAWQDPQSQARLALAGDYDVVILVSANAAVFAASTLQNKPNIRELAVIGQATAAKCAELGLNVQHQPAQADSEGLLALSRFQNMQGQKVLIVRGRGGRELLADELRRRGAQVDYAEVYERTLPELELDASWARVDVIVVTSGEILDNLAMLARRDQQDWVFERQLLVIHERIASRAMTSGFTLTPLVASTASDSGLIDALLTWAQSQRSE